MLKLLYGTGNTAKFETMRSRIAGLPIELIRLSDYPPVSDPLENGETPLENARIKAHAYWTAFHAPCFSCDSGLYLSGIPGALQPGVRARRVNGRHLDDEAMIAYYSLLAKTYGRVLAGYRNAICLIMDETHIYERFDDSLHGASFYLTDVPHEKRIPGFPLDSISVDEYGRYYLDTGDKVDDPPEGEGFPAFFASVLEQYNQ